MRPPLTPPAFESWSMSDGYVIRGRLWPPAAGSRVGVLYLHGIQSHGGWFEHSASLLNRCGAAVLLADRRGSGLNAADRGDVARPDRWLDDLDELAAGFTARFELERLAVLGVSWGGKLALAWLLRGPARVTHALLVAPGLHAAVDVSLLTRLQIAGALLVAPRTRFKIPLDDPALFTENPAGQQFIRADGARLTHVTARFLCSSRALDLRLRRAGTGAVHQITAIVLADRERIIDSHRTLGIAQRLVGSCLRVHQIPDSSHTLEFDRAPERYQTLLEIWGGEIAGNPTPAWACITPIGR